jgi:hypothetical protein
MNKPYSIKIFLSGGDPDGLRTIEKSNWSGAGIVIPRSLMSDRKIRRELARTGVYVLVGPREESGLPRMYVGEGTRSSRVLGSTRWKSCRKTPKL